MKNAAFNKRKTEEPKKLLEFDLKNLDDHS